MATLYTNFLAGVVDNNPLSNSGTSLSSSALASMPAVSGGNVMWLVLDPEGVDGAPEVVQVTAHTLSATTATIVRAQQSTSARQHNQNTAWVVAATAADMDELPAKKLTSTGDLLYASAANVAARLAVGTNGQALVSNGTIPGWGQVGTAGIADSAVTSAKIADGTIVAGDLASDAVTTAKILDSNVTTGKLADSAVTSAKIADGTIVAGDLASDAVTTVKILDGNVTTDKLADSAVTSAKIANGTIVAADLASDAVTTAKILDSNVTTAKIADSAVTSAKIADGTIVNADVNASAAIAYSKLNLSGSVVNADIGSSAAIAYSKLGALPAVILGRGSTFNVSASTATAAAFSAETLDSHGFHDTGSNTERITIPSGLGGLYLFGYQIRYAAATSGARQAWIDLNGSGISDQRMAESSVVSASAGSLTGVGLLTLAQGDYLRVVCYCTGATVTFGDSTLVDRFWAVRISA